MVQKSNSARSERSTRAHTNQRCGRTQTVRNQRCFLRNRLNREKELPFPGTIAQISIKAAFGVAVRSIEDCCQCPGCVSKRGVSDEDPARR